MLSLVLVLVRLLVCLSWSIFLMMSRCLSWCQITHPPHLYSVYINTLPSLLRQVAAPATHLVPSSGRSDAGMVPVNSLLFADDVAVIGSAKSVKEMLKLCEQHSLSLGYRWNPTKCAVLNHPPSSSSSSLPSSSDRLQLYDTPLPTVDEFVYLGVPFVKSGLSAPSLVSLRSPGVIKVVVSTQLAK
ncbi:hypothetical protein G6F57_020089 [Rhizopus arrhizus]|nr:hypothetical protein G6F57_020089 [Rhizopus arrhizus]